MFVAELFCFVVLMLVAVEGHISIDIDPEDVDKIADFFETIISLNPHQQFLQPVARTRCCIIRLSKKIVSGVFQMFGIMITLVGANLLTTKLSQVMTSNSQSVVTEYSYKLEEIHKNHTGTNQIEMCDSKNDFGCNRGLCWRSCTQEVFGGDDYESWCFSAPEKRAHKMHPCKNSLDCSGCWTCSYPCVRKVCYFF